MPGPMEQVLAALAARRPETTRLTPQEEMLFRIWAVSNGIKDVDAPQGRYDYRGYWKEHGMAPMQFGVDHFTDRYKQHGHPLFSSESQYSRGVWDGGQWLPGDVLVPPPMPSHRGK